MTQATTAKKVTAEEVKKEIEGGKKDFSNLSITGNLCLSGAMVKEELIFRKTIFEGSLNFEGATFKESLSFEGATFEGSLNFKGVILKKPLNLATKKGPLYISVNENMAELIHYANPNVPLVLSS